MEEMQFVAIDDISGPALISHIKDALNMNTTGFMKSVTLSDSGGDYLRFSCTKKIFGAASSLSAAIEVLDTVVTVIGIVRNPVLNETSFPCSVTISLVRRNGDIPAGTSITFPLSKRRYTKDIILKVNNEDLQKVVEKFGLTLLVKSENNHGEIVWSITIPRLRTIGVFPSKRKTVGGEKETTIVDGVEVEGHRERKVSRIIEVFDD